MDPAKIGRATGYGRPRSAGRNSGRACRPWPAD